MDYPLCGEGSLHAWKCQDQAPITIREGKVLLAAGGMLEENKWRQYQP
jgi:hypothetical protein